MPLATAAGDTLRADAVVLAMPAFVAEALTGETAPGLAAGLASIRYVSTGTVSLGYRLADIRRPLLGFGLVVPGSERRPINAITWSSLKFDHRAPGGSRPAAGLLRRLAQPAVDGAGRRRRCMATVRAQLAELMGIEAAPLFHRIYRWQRSNPQYDVGHLERVAAIEAALPAGALPDRQPLSRRRPARLHQAGPGNGRQIIAASLVETS